MPDGQRSVVRAQAQDDRRAFGSDIQFAVRVLTSWNRSKRVPLVQETWELVGSFLGGDVPRYGLAAGWPRFALEAVFDRYGMDWYFPMPYADGDGWF